MCAHVTAGARRVVLLVLGCLALASPVYGNNLASDERVEPQGRLDLLEQRIERIADRIDLLHTRLEGAVSRLEAIHLNAAAVAAAPRPVAATPAATAVAALSPARPEPKTWIVAITNNPDPEVAHLFERLEGHRDRLPQITERLNAARQRYLELRAEDSADPASVADARREMIDLGYDKREVKALVRRLSLEIDQARGQRIVEGLTGDGTVVRIHATGSMSDLAGALLEGNTYSVTGTGDYDDDGLVEITMTSAELSNLGLPVADALGE